VVVRFNTRTLHQRVASVEEFAYIAAKILFEYELPTWMELIVAVKIKD
jgi:hypothetical protein